MSTKFLRKNELKELAKYSKKKLLYCSFYVCLKGFPTDYPLYFVEKAGLPTFITALISRVKKT